jgi:error-prone DNA polymerase
MSAFERLATDYATQGHTTGPHPMALWRRQFTVTRNSPASKPQNQDGGLLLSTPPLRASDFINCNHGQHIIIAGQVICRQRPGTAKGHCFISLEDETGIANLFVPRDTFQQYRLIITTEQFLLCHGRIQVGEGNSHTLYTTSVEPLPFPAELSTASHDFH